MPPLRSRFAATVTALALATPLGLASLAAGPADAATTAQVGVGVGATLREAGAAASARVSTWNAGRRAAEAALDRAQHRLAAGRPAPARPVGDRSDFTLTLRALKVGLRYLDPGDRAAARSVLARPSQGVNDPNGDGYRVKPRRSCSTHVCVWRVTSTSDKASRGQVALTKQVMEHVWDRIVTQGGYRAPRPDRGRGGDNRLDVYLADIGDDGLFGYCAPEGMASGRSASGYCVLDNDFSPDQFGASQTVTANLEVTAAHEFFHAVQFAYDVDEDDWFMEGTAMWMEDEIYTDVNDNVRYLQGSQLTTPTRSLDQAANGLGGPYVSWIFWRYLSETFDDDGGTGLPLVVRDVWRRAQAYTWAYPRTYSMRALGRAVAARGNSLANVFARFGEANRHPRDAYTEGEQQHYPTAPAVSRYRLSGSVTSTGEKVATMAHMTNYTVVLLPGSDLTAAGWVVRIPVNAPSYARGARAQISVVVDDGTGAGKRTRRWVPLDKYGNGVATAQFRYGHVRRVELTLTNAGQRYACNRATLLSCQGTPLDNGLKTYFQATVRER